MLEDISRTHKMMDLNAGLSPEQVQSCLRSIARFHALSLSHSHFNGPWTKGGETAYLSDFVDSFRTDEQHQGFMDTNLQTLHGDMQAEGGFEEEAEALQRIRKQVSLKSFALLKECLSFSDN